MDRSGSHPGAFAIVQAAAIDDTRMQPAALRMLLALGIYRDTEGWCWPKQKQLASRLGISQQAVSKALRDLARWGYIEIHDQYNEMTGARISSRYRLVMDFTLPVEYRRTPQADVVTPQLEIVTPTTLDVVTPTTPRVVAIEQPKITTQDNNLPPTEVGAAVAARPPAKVRRSKTSSRPGRTGDETPCPDALDLTEQSYETAGKWGFDRDAVDFQLERFLDSARANGRAYVDWKAAFRTWLLNEVQYAKRDRRPVGTRPTHRNGAKQVPPGAASAQMSEWKDRPTRHGYHSGGSTDGR